MLYNRNQGYKRKANMKVFAAEHENKGLFVSVKQFRLKKKERLTFWIVWSDPPVGVFAEQQAAGC